MDQMRELMREDSTQTDARRNGQVAVIVAADRLNVQAANAFLKTLEEPPPKSVLILLTTEPAADSGDDSFALSAVEFRGRRGAQLDAAQLEWLAGFSDGGGGAEEFAGPVPADGCAVAAAAEMRERIEELTARSPLENHTMTRRRICASGGRMN